MSQDPPPENVLRAFAADPEIRRLTGGQGTSWVAGSLVLKPGGEPEHRWMDEALRGVAFDGVRVASPVASSDGAWVVDGWTATRFLAGSEPDLAQSSTLLGVVDAGRAFHRAVAHLPRPDFIDHRNDPWALADRVAWGEQEMRFLPELTDLVTRLQDQPDPPGESQVVHGDLTGNVLFAPGLSPAIIDVTPYWRPPSYAEGIVLADALCYHGAGAAALRLLDITLAAAARALLFRVATTNAFATSGSGQIDLDDEVRRYERAASAVGT